MDTHRGNINTDAQSPETNAPAPSVSTAHQDPFATFPQNATPHPRNQVFP